MKHDGEKVKKLVAKLEQELDSTNIVNTKYCVQDFHYSREIAKLNADNRVSKDKDGFIKGNKE